MFVGSLQSPSWHVLLLISNVFLLHIPISVFSCARLLFAYRHITSSSSFVVIVVIVETVVIVVMFSESRSRRWLSKVLAPFIDGNGAASFPSWLGHRFPTFPPYDCRNSYLAAATAAARHPFASLSPRPLLSNLSLAVSISGRPPPLVWMQGPPSCLVLGANGKPCLSIHLAVLAQGDFPLWTLNPRRFLHIVAPFSYMVLLVDSILL